MTKLQEHRDAIYAAAAKHGLPSRMVAAVVMIESAGDPAAWNPEPRYRYFVDCRTGKPFRRVTAAEIASKFPPADFPCLAGDPDQEWWAQQASWSLMQTMGAVARERGCKSSYLVDLARFPAMALDVGCRYLASLVKRFPSPEGLDAIAAHNGGSPRRDAAGNLVPVLAAYVVKYRAAYSSLGGW